MQLAKKFTKKNAVHPFDDASSLEFFSEKNDASLLVFGSSSKKRPHTLTFVRTFDNKILDMLELHLDPESSRMISQFKGRKFAVGLRPMSEHSINLQYRHHITKAFTNLETLVVFAGTAFDSPVENEYTRAKSMFIDFFKGEVSDKIDVEGLQYIVSISAEEPVGDDDVKAAIHLRVYLISTKRSGQKLPRVEVEEMGPRMDFRVGRMQEPEEAMWKEALKKPKVGEEKTKKNVSTDTMGDKLGRIHLGRQDLSELQTRKMKGLKRSRDVEDGPAEKVDDESVKKSKK
jgi:ribosome production factor 2